MDDMAAKLKQEREQNHLLLKAAALGILDDVKTLIEMGATLECQAKGRTSPLHFAAAGGHVDIIEFMLSRGVDIDAEDGSGRTPLHAAALTGKLDAVSALVKKGALVDISDGADDTPLSLACRYDARDVVELLLRSGGKLDTVNKDGLTPLGETLVNNCVDTAEALLAAGAALTPARGYPLCHLVAGLGHADALKLLLSKGADPSDQGNTAGITALHCAVLGCHPDAVEVLLKWAKDKKKTAMLNAGSRGGRTPLDCAHVIASEPDATGAGADAPKLAERVTAALAKASCKTAKAAGVAPPAADGGDGGNDSFAGRFAAQPEAEQKKRLQRWIDGSDAEAVAAGLEGAALEHVRAARTLRHEADLEDVTAGLLENDEWQALLRQPKVRAVVEEIQADPTAMRRWGDVPEAVEAMGEFRKLQAFCTPRGLKTNLTRLARTEEVTPDAARARATRNRTAAGIALEAARKALIALANGAAPEEKKPAPAASGAAASPSSAKASSQTEKPAAKAAAGKADASPKAEAKSDGAEAAAGKDSAPPAKAPLSKEAEKAKAKEAAAATALAKKEAHAALIRNLEEADANWRGMTPEDLKWPGWKKFFKQAFGKFWIRIAIFVVSLFIFVQTDMIELDDDSPLGRLFGSAAKRAARGGGYSSVEEEAAWAEDDEWIL